MQFLLRQMPTLIQTLFLIDDQIDGKKNVVSATFRDNEATYLAGVALLQTKQKRTKSVFVGGEEGS